jgi:hypothetical protein
VFYKYISLCVTKFEVLINCVIQIFKPTVIKVISASECQQDVLPNLCRNLSESIQFTRVPLRYKTHTTLSEVVAERRKKERVKKGAGVVASNEQHEKLWATCTWLRIRSKSSSSIKGKEFFDQPYKYQALNQSASRT